ncbi:hypothetical protein OQA88_1311 [Cercophora sp. LCS_1]
MMLITLLLMAGLVLANPNPNPQNGWKLGLKGWTKSAKSDFNAFAKTVGQDLDQLAHPEWYDPVDPEVAKQLALKNAEPVTQVVVPIPNIYKIFPPLFSQTFNVLEKRGGLATEIPMPTMMPMPTPTVVPTAAPVGLDVVLAVRETFITMLRDESTTTECCEGVEGTTV